MINKILIANRGEIAVRIIRACRELSISTVAAYSLADRTSLHVQLADEAICIGPSAPIESYLNVDAIINAAKETGVDAIHPGYGFLAENHNFARRCEKEGIIFIGPNSAALRLVGDKLESRETMEKADIPIIPGMKSSSNDLKVFREEAKRIGYPVLVKASLGGGGKAMRVVHVEKELDSAIEAGMREAKSAFGDDTIYLEKYIEEPRHIEFQVLADEHGHAIHLFERECSIQRRHQKIVEETPSVAINDNIRAKMGQIAIKAIKVAGYTNAGTVEFLLDKNGNFYFLEVNARIQVEHPITEFVTGVDLVKQQIRIANGAKLSIKQSNLNQRGHAMECRIYAEDPTHDFLPSPGKVLFVNEPKGPGIRVDSGIYSGYEVSPYYDPILSKVIAWGEDREAARTKMIAALSDYIILGIKTTIDFERAIMMNTEFVAGNTYTGFINDNMKDWHESDGGRFLMEALVAAAIDSYVKATQRDVTKLSPQRPLSPWQTLGKWEIASRSKE